MKLEKGKVYLGHVVGATTFIGVYDDKLKCLVNVWGISIKDTNVKLIPAAHPIFLQKKISEDLLKVQVNISNFLFFTDINEIAVGEDLFNIYTEVTTGVKITPSSNEDISEAIQNKIKSKGMNGKKSNIIQ